MLWACIVLPQLALDSVLRQHPVPARPLAVVAGPSARQRVHAANAAAMALGVHAGQALSAALLCCPTLAQHAFDLQACQRSKELLAAWAYRYSAQVSTSLPDAIALEVQHSFAVLGSWPRIEARLRAELAQLGFQHRIALAPNATAAWVLAGHQDGLALSTSEATWRALRAVPTVKARLPESTANALAQVGLTTLGKVFAVPRPALGRRYGSSMLTHLDRLMGQAPEPLILYRPAPVFDGQIELPSEISSMQALLFPLRRLTADLAAFLQGRNGGVQRFVLTLKHANNVPDTDINVGLLGAVRAPELLFTVSKARLENLRLPAPVRALNLLANELPELLPAAQPLFDDAAQNAHSLLALCESLRARLGDDAVYALAATCDHRPEKSWQRIPLIHHNTSTPRANKPAPALMSAAVLPRPTWLLATPKPLIETPLRVIAGPERIESGWWDSFDVQRDYYVLETPLGQRAWAFCAPGTVGPFMLHGWFA
jgi:protein ImuB